MATNVSTASDAGAAPASTAKGSEAGVDLDPFLSLVESRLRNPYSSLELSRLLASSKTSSGSASGAAHHVSSSAGSAAADTGAGSRSQEADNVMLLGRVFDRMAKPVQLRSIVGLMGLEGSSAGTGAGGDDKLNKAIWDILSRASAEDGDDGVAMEDTEAAVSGATNDVTGQPDVEDNWVSVLASLVQNAMFYKDQSQAEEERCTQHLESVAESIIRTICETAAASGAAAGASSEGDEATHGTGTPAPDATSSKGKLDPLHFVPQSLALLPPSKVKSYIPESASNNDFTVNADAPILKVDADAEQSRADEETKELENRERIHRMAQQQQKLQGTGGGTGGRGRGIGGRAGAAGRGVPSRSALGAGRGGRGLGRQSAAGLDTASLFIRSKKPTTSGATLGRGTAKALLGRGRGVAGPNGGRAVAGRGRGMGRGSAAAAVGKSLGVPTKKPIAMSGTGKRPGNKSLTGGSAGVGSGGAAAASGGVVGGTGASALKGRAGRAMKASAGGMGGRSKMMMIDSAEVVKLNKEKKAAEDAATTSGKSRKRKIMEAAAAEEAAKRSKSMTGIAAPSSPAISAAAAPAAPIPPVVAMPASSAPDAAVPDGLLSKSNKLSSADRSRVERFFSDRFNPTPDQMMYKMKINEERSTDAETGQSIKETLYLELDYSTFGYKKTRKIKKK